MIKEPDSRVRTFGVFACAGAFLLAGCGAAEQPTPPVEQTSAPAPAPAPTVKPAVSVNAVMVALVDHAGHVIWDAEKPERAPKTDVQWAELEHHAIQLAGSGTLVALGGTGQADAGWVQSPDWQKYSQDMTNAALAILTAVRSKNQESLVAANGQLVQSCEACHKQFKPDLPTEGIVHAHID